MDFNVQGVKKYCIFIKFVVAFYLPLEPKLPSKILSKICSFNYKAKNK